MSPPEPVSTDTSQLLEHSAPYRGWTEQDRGPYHRDIERVRRDIAGDRPGAPRPLGVRLTTSDGRPLLSVAMDIWHCDALGRCGGRMTVRYHTRRGQSLPEYSCQREGIERAEAPCQRIMGADIDRAVGELLVESMSPLALEVALCVQDELAARADDADRLRRQQVERARYEADLAQRRYLRVDPDNRLVAATLEAEWNTKLRALEAAQEDYERRREADVLMDDESRERVLGLATDFSRLWRDPATPARERKRMARLLIEDVTLLKADDLVVHVRFRGGATRSLRLPRPLPAADLHKLDPAVVAEVDRLLEDHTDAEIADALNAAGHQPPVGERFSIWVVWKIRKAHRLESRFDRLRRRGMLTLGEMADALGVHPQTVKDRATRGQLVSVAYNDKGQRLYAPPEPRPLIPCARCGKLIPERAGQGQLRKYCGVNCRTAAYAARRRATGWVRPPRHRGSPAEHTTSSPSTQQEV